MRPATRREACWCRLPRARRTERSGRVSRRVTSDSQSTGTGNQRGTLWGLQHPAPSLACHPRPAAPLPEGSHSTTRRSVCSRGSRLALIIWAPLLLLALPHMYMRAVRRLVPLSPSRPCSSTHILKQHTRASLTRLLAHTHSRLSLSLSLSLSLARAVSLLW